MRYVAAIVGAAAGAVVWGGLVSAVVWFAAPRLLSSPGVWVATPPWPALWLVAAAVHLAVGLPRALAAATRGE